METNSLSVRKQGEGDKGTMSVDDFAAHINTEVENLLKFN